MSSVFGANLFRLTFLIARFFTKISFAIYIAMGSSVFVLTGQANIIEWRSILGLWQNHWFLRYVWMSVETTSDKLTRKRKNYVKVQCARKFESKKRLWNKESDSRAKFGALLAGDMFKNIFCCNTLEDDYRDSAARSSRVLSLDYIVYWRSHF